MEVTMWASGYDYFPSLLFLLASWMMSGQSYSQILTTEYTWSLNRYVVQNLPTDPHYVCMCSVAQSRLTLCLHGLWPTRLLCPWNPPEKNTGIGYNFLLQGIFPSQGSNLSFLHWQSDILPLSHQGSPPIPGNSSLVLYYWIAFHCMDILHFQQAHGKMLHVTNHQRNENQMSYHFTFVRMTIVKKTTDNKC